MDDEYPVARCPFCGSVLTNPLGKAGMRECRYHLCRAVFPDRHIRGPDQAPLVCEGGKGDSEWEPDMYHVETGTREESVSGELRETP